MMIALHMTFMRDLIKVRQFKAYDKRTHKKFFPSYVYSSNGGTLRGYIYNPDELEGIAVPYALTRGNTDYYLGDIVECGHDGHGVLHDVVQWSQGQWEPVCYYGELKVVGNLFNGKDHGLWQLKSN